MIGHVDTPSNGQPTIGRPFYGQAKGQLRLTCAFYAECAHESSKGAKGAEGSKGCGGRPSEKRGASMKKRTNALAGAGKAFPFLVAQHQKGGISSSEARLLGFRCRHATYILIAAKRRYLPLCTVGAGPYGNTVHTVQHCFIAPKKLSIPESFLISFKNQNILRIPVNP